MAKQPRFTPTEDNNEVVIGEHTVELEAGKGYTKKMLLKAFAAVEAEEDVLEAVADELLGDHGEVPEDAEGEAPELSGQVATAEVVEVRVRCPKCGAAKILPVPRDSEGKEHKTKCQTCNTSFAFKV